MRGIKINQRGFTLVEILIAIAIVAFFGVIVVPNFRARMPSYERQQFVTRLNAFVRLAAHNAMVTGNVHEVHLDIVKKSLYIRAETGKKDNQGRPIFNRVTIPALETSYTWDDHLDIKNFYIDGTDQIGGLGLGIKKKLEVWFYIAPDGLTQEVVINLIDTKDKDPDGKSKRIHLVLNPFSAQFKEYDGFQKSSQ